MSEKNFGYLGLDFQKSLIKAIIEDKKYGVNIIDVIESEYFDNTSFRFIIENLKELYISYEKIPDYVTIEQKIISETGQLKSHKVHLDSLKIIKETTNDTEYVKETALNFCKQQNLKKEIKKIQSIIDNGNFEEYKTIEGIIQEALQIGTTNDHVIDVFDDIDRVLEDDFRLPIPTGIDGIDEVLKGGLGKGEFGVILAPTGTGKTSLITKFANTAYNVGHNVLQIFFEDNPDNIKRKHYTIWSEVSPDDQPKNKDLVKEKVSEAKTLTKGALKMVKMPSDGVTVFEIKKLLRKLASEGFKVDMLLIDYVDCLSPEKSNYNEEWKGEGSIMRQLESMCDEFNIAIWTATQGNRASISSEVVTADLMGGSIKKAQIGHVVISIGKTLEQKEQKLATLSVIKSRIGKDGVVFNNCTFDNEYLIFSTDEQTTFLGHEIKKAEKNKTRAAELYKKRNNMDVI